MPRNGTLPFQLNGISKSQSAGPTATCTSAWPTRPANPMRLPETHAKRKKRKASELTACSSNNSSAHVAGKYFQYTSVHHQKPSSKFFPSKFKNKNTNVCIFHPTFTIQQPNSLIQLIMEESSTNILRHQTSCQHIFLITQPFPLI